MALFPVFLSVVVVVRNEQSRVAALLSDVCAELSRLASDYELIVVDNASDDGTVGALRALTQIDGLPNLQVYALVKSVDSDTASWVGLENALGDFVAVFDPLVDDIGFLEKMLSVATGGIDVVFAHNEQSPPRGLMHRLGHQAFDVLYKWFA